MADTGLTHGVWRERIPDLLQECADEWNLRLGDPYVPGAAGYAVRAELPDGTVAVLKLIYPHREAEWEAEAGPPSPARRRRDAPVGVRRATLAWAFDNTHIATHIETIRRLLEDA